MEKIIRRYKLSLLLSVAATAIASGMIGNVLGNIVESYQLADYQNGFMSSCISFGSLGALVIGSCLRNRITKATFISAGGLLMAIALILKSLQAPFVIFLVFSVFLGIGIGIIDSNQSSFLVDLDPSRTGQNLGVLHGIFGLSGLLLPLLIRQMLEVLEWHYVYLIMGLISLCLVAQFIVFSSTIGRQVPQTKRLESPIALDRLQNFYMIRSFWFCGYVCLSEPWLKMAYWCGQFVSWEIF